MFVCLCTGVTSHVVADLVAQGASSTKDIARACGAGMDCGRCRRTVRATISAAKAHGGSIPSDCHRARESTSTAAVEDPSHARPVTGLYGCTA